MIGNKKHIKHSFFLDLFFKDKCFPHFYKKITNTFLNSDVYNCSNSNLNINYSTYTVYDIPNYLVTEFIDSTSLKILTTQLYPGYIIDLTCFNNLEDYLNNHLGRPRKSQLKRYKKRLDLCINPTYKKFYGDISKDEYHLLFNQLKTITKHRFNQKEELNFELPFLELYEDIMYTLIRNKKACIFAIYDKKKPINITLNFIDDETIFHWNSCYDIDYQMFNLGHINMINHLEWAFKNGFKLFDMSRGDFHHKRKYINKNYIYNQQIIYNAKSFSASIIAHLTVQKLKTRYALIKILKKTNLHLWYGKYAKFKYLKVQSGKEKVVQKEIKVDFDILEIPEIKKLKQIDLLKNENTFLVKPFNYFLYKNQEFVDNVKIYVDKNDNKIYYFKGIKKHQKVIITN